MNRIVTLPLVLAASLCAHAQTITQVDLAFVPSTLTVDAGQEITITLGAPHTATEVSEDTWNANGNTPNGGFDLAAGTHTLTLDEPGTYYYVCSPHAGMGMKGRIIVTDGTGVVEGTVAPKLRLLPNPAAHEIQVTEAVAGQMLVLIDARGSEVLRQAMTGADRVDITALAAGCYNAILSDGTGRVVAREKLMIVR